jgi:hypothetical protein
MAWAIGVALLSLVMHSFLFQQLSVAHLVPGAGATLTSKEKLDIARNLAKLGVDIIEVGLYLTSFPAHPHYKCTRKPCVPYGLNRIHLSYPIPRSTRGLT